MLLIQEVYILEKFPEDFYDIKMKVSVIGLIRCEADFKAFGNIFYDNFELKNIFF